jgi:hypothetical protein
MNLEVALPIIRALADGVNPVTGETYPEQSPYAEPRTLRALYAAVDQLEKEVQRQRRHDRHPANFGKPWSEDEDRLLAGEFDAGHTITAMAHAHHRTQSSVRLRLEKLSKIKPTAA